MDYFDLGKVDSIIVTFENLQQCHIDPSVIKELCIEQSKLPTNSIDGTSYYSTMICFDKDIYRKPDIFDRLHQYQDITWFDVAFKEGLTCTWQVPWVSDPDCECKNRLQHNNTYSNGFSIYIKDFEGFQ